MPRPQGWPCQNWTQVLDSPDCGFCFCLVFHIYPILFPLSNMVEARENHLNAFVNAK